MIQFFVALAITAFLHASAHAADKVRMSMTGFAGQFMTFPLAQKRDFLKEEGIEAEIIRISAAAGRAALCGGEVDYSTGIGGTLSGIPIKVVACAGIKVNSFLKSNRDGTIQILIEWLKLNRETAMATYDSVVKDYDDDDGLCEKGLRLVIDETKKTMKLSRVVPYSDIAELSILREAQRELGIQAR